MLDPGRMVAAAVARRQAASYADACPDATPAEARMLGGLVGWALGRIARSDALYHDIDHSVAVIEVARLLLRGRLALGSPPPAGDWRHLIAAAALHDIGYVRGICAGDRPGIAAIGPRGASCRLAPDATDAALAPHHVDRAHLVIGERLAAVPGLDAARLGRAVAATRFPPPAAGEEDPADAEGRLARAADLIGQFADPAYPRKVLHLFVEFEETGEAARLGVRGPGDLWSGFPDFYDAVVAPHVAIARPLLAATPDGRAVLEALARNRRRAAILDRRPRTG